jgi:hypothetical protein
MDMMYLNGKHYYTKENVRDVAALVKLNIENPFEDQEVLQLTDDKERKNLDLLVDTICNLLMWNFTNESAITLKSIETTVGELKFSDSNIIDYEDYKLLLDGNTIVPQVTVDQFGNYLHNYVIELFMERFPTF